MTLMQFDAMAEYAPVKTLVIADTLSCSPVENKGETTEKVIEYHVNAISHS